MCIPRAPLLNFTFLFILLILLNHFHKQKEAVDCGEHLTEKNRTSYSSIAAQKMMFSIKDFFSKCDQIRRKLRIWSYLLKKSVTENFFFCAVLFKIYK